MSKRTLVILLKTKSSPTDPYDTFLKSKRDGFEPVFVPVLEHRFLEPALDELEQVIREDAVRSATAGPEGAVSEDELCELGGLLITSQRAVEALGFLLERLRSSGQTSHVDRLLTSIVYVVGPATRNAVVSLGFRSENVLGAHCGSGAILSPYILSTFEKSRPQNRRRKLLFLSGEKRSDIIPKLLAAEDIPENDRVGIREIPMYATSTKSDFPSDFSSIMNVSLLEGFSSRWIVVFSASSCEHVVKVMKEQKEIGPPTYLASIGPTTETYLIDKLGVAPEVVAASPSPEGVWEGIRNFLEKQ